MKCLLRILRCSNMLTARVVWTLSTFALIMGYDDLSTKKRADQYKRDTACSSCVATNALDRNISTCTQTIMGITSENKFTWWYVDLGDVQSVYNIRIQFRDYGQTYLLRQRGRFAGFSLYVSNTNETRDGILCYKDGPDLPPLDFNINCITHGRYVIFCNKRRNTSFPSGYEKSNVFTELCEVTVTGCPSSGVYGENCDKTCPTHCQKQRCDIINGTCLGCTPGWLSEHCDKACSSGYYGQNCESKCAGHCKDSKSCNHTSGLCDDGCDDGWTGSNCTKECPTQTYGPDCEQSCSGHCLGDFFCNRTTGRCDTGCKPGFTGELCDAELKTTGFKSDDFSFPKGCENGTFGKDCSNHCSGHCLNNVPCNSTTGQCDSGCASGFVGDYCKEIAVESNTSNDSNCNEPSYIAGLSFLVIITIVLGIACLIFMRKYYRLLRMARSPQYTSITRTSQQPDNNSNDCQQYEELRIAVSENGYHNIEIRN